jgi:hypothetical protein
MQFLEVAYIINATKFYYLNFLRRLILRLLLVTLGRDISVTSRLTSLLTTPNTLLSSCLITYFLGGLFNTSLEVYFLFSRGCRVSLTSSLSLVA